MARLEPKPSTVKKLFALSGNLCAFPSCNQSLVDTAGNLLGEICHIEAAEPGGERYNPSQSDEERREFSNLIVLCSIHHTVTDDVNKYDVNVLKDMKKNHEAKFQNNEFIISTQLVNRIVTEDEKIKDTKIFYNYDSFIDSKLLASAYESLYGGDSYDVVSFSDYHYSPYMSISRTVEGEYFNQDLQLSHDKFVRHLGELTQFLDDNYSTEDSITTARLFVPNYPDHFTKLINKDILIEKLNIILTKTIQAHHEYRKLVKQMLSI